MLGRLTPRPIVRRRTTRIHRRKHLHDSADDGLRTNIRRDNAGPRLAAPITAAGSHASLARAFLVRFCDDPDLLAMVQYHDEPFALWRQLEAKGRFNQTRLDALLTTIKDWNLFLAFNIVDGCTQGKSRAPLHWLFGQVKGKMQSTFAAADIL